MNIKIFLETAKGGINLTQGLALARLAATVDAGDIVEIGSYKGKSAVALGYGIKQAGRSGKTRLFCIDPHCAFVGELGGKFGPMDRRDFYLNMIDTGTYEEAALINLPARDVALAWKSPIGFLFIDGDHRYPAVRDDFFRWLPHVLDGGIVALDDSTLDQLGPTRLVAELADAGFVPFEQVEKISVFRKLPNMPQQPLAPVWQSVLVVAERNIVAGGLLRFLRMHRAIHPFGIQVSFAFDDLSGPWHPEGCEVLPMETAMSRQWDATILPGAGFSESFLDGLNRFCIPTQGTRVQAVLNDQTKFEQFLRANNVFAPHSVIFNSRDWAPGSYSHFKGDRFSVLEGAVDCAQFAPAIAKGGAREGAFVVGLQSKYVTELAGIAPLLPPTVRFRVMRADLPVKMPQGLADLVQANRLEFVGLVAEADLLAFYHSCDCILHLETFAGWANIVAEAMACGIPVVCSAAGTAAIAEHGVTALVVPAQDLSAVAAAITAVQADPDDARFRAQQARSRILGFGWEAYGSAFLAAARDDGRKHYLHAPEYGLRGKWPLVSRLEGIEPLLPFAKGADVLDIGCAEGVIADRLLDAGAKSVHGVDIDGERIVTARYICAKQYKNAVFKIDSVTPWPEFVTRNALLLQNSYDIVLYLAVHQHLDFEHRDKVLNGLIGLAMGAFAIRMPDALFADQGIDARLSAAGFDEHAVGGSTIGGAGKLRIYIKRKKAL
jgi:hypothetical protein